MSEKCYINTHYLKKRQIAPAFANGMNADGSLPAANRAYCGFQQLRGGFGKSVTVTVFGIRPKGVLS